MSDSPSNMSTAFAREPQKFLQQAIEDWGGKEDYWVFGYASLIWRPEFEFAERREAKVYGWHRALKMWSRTNRGTLEFPGLVCAMLPGGSCQGAVFRIPAEQGMETLKALWSREMPRATYDPKWLTCRTPQGEVKALAFTLSRQSPGYCGTLTPEQYQHIFGEARGVYGSTRDYALATYEGLKNMGIHDRSLEQVLRWAKALDA